MLLAALLRPLCPRAFTATIAIPSTIRHTAVTTAEHVTRGMSTTTNTASSSSATQVAGTDHHPQPAPGATASGNSASSGGNDGREGDGNEVPPIGLSKNRQSQKSWRKKDGNTKARGMKRARVQPGEEAGGAKGVNKQGGGGASSQRSAGWENRKIFEGYHPGSYAGDLVNKLGPERLQQLQEYQEREASKPAQRESSAVADSGGEAGDNPEGTEAASFSKKKVALLVAYRGSNYQGLQINEDAVTVEAEVELALHLSGGISKNNFGNLRKVAWSRAGRTDKGVHAAAQIITLKLAYATGQEKETIEEINRYLPEDIRAFDIVRTPKSFDARERCTGRRYEYIMPTYVLAPKDDVAAMFAEAIDWEKCEASKITGATASEITPTTAPAAFAQNGAIDGNGGQAGGELGGDAEVGNDGDGHGAGVGGKRWHPEIELSSVAVVRRVAERMKGHRVQAETVESLRAVLKQFCGTKNYHNFTNNKKGGDSSCNRYITSFTTSDPWESDHMEWIRLTVTGQSFLLHQIRKMVAASVDRVRGFSSEEDFAASFSPTTKFNLGIAPSQGLYLERPFYEGHNKHVRAQGVPEKALEWNAGPVAEALEKFKKETIQHGILAQESTDHHFVAWLDRLTRYPCTYKPIGLLEVTPSHDEEAEVAEEA